MKCGRYRGKREGDEELRSAERAHLKGAGRISGNARNIRADVVRRVAFEIHTEGRSGRSFQNKNTYPSDEGCSEMRYRFLRKIIRGRMIHARWIRGSKLVLASLDRLLLEAREFGGEDEVGVGRDDAADTTRS